MTLADLLILFGSGISTLISFYLLATMVKVWTSGRLATTDDESSE